MATVNVALRSLSLPLFGVQLFEPQLFSSHQLENCETATKYAFRVFRLPKLLKCYPDRIEQAQTAGVTVRRAADLGGRRRGRTENERAAPRKSRSCEGENRARALFRHLRRGGRRRAETTRPLLFLKTAQAARDCPVWIA